MSFFEVFRAGSKTFPKLIDDMGAKVTALKNAGKEVSVDNFVDALRRDQHLKDGLTASYVDFMSKAAEKGLNGRLARAEFIRGIVQSLPEPLTSDPEKLKAVYKNTAQFLDETGKAFLDTKKARAVDAISETLSNLMVGKFNRDQLDARLKALETAAKNHDLIDADLVREPAKGLELAKGMVPGMKAKEAEKRLLAGEKITPDEMLSLIKAKHADFDKWEKITTEKAIKDKVRAEGRYSPERAAASSLVSSALKWPLAAAGTLAAALGIGIAADRFFLGGEGKVQAVDSVKNTISGFRTSTEAGLERRKQEEFAQRVRTCNAQMGEVGEVSGNCIIARFSEEFSTLSNVFNAEGLTEAERLYAKKIGEALPTAYRDAEGSAQKFNTIANRIRVNAVEEMKNDITMKGHLPVDPTNNQVSFRNVDRMIQADIAKNPFLAAKLQ